MIGKLLAAVVMVVALMSAGPAPSAQADTFEGGSAYVTLIKDKDRCGPSSLYYCWEWQLRADPAGWFRGYNLVFHWWYRIDDGPKKGENDESCYYTDGSSCTRRSPEYHWGPGLHNDKICTYVKLTQLVHTNQTAVDGPYKKCFYTMADTTPARKVAR